MTVARSSKQRRPAGSRFLQQLIEVVALRNRTGDVIQLTITSRQQGGFPGIGHQSAEDHAIKSDGFLVPQKIDTPVIEGKFDTTAGGSLY
nr:hypothetical protein [Sulfuritalea sp.]